jgi:hypothetical protein
MLEFVLVVHLATTSEIHKVHAYERHGYATLADCEHERDEITSKIVGNKLGAVMTIWCEPDTPPKQ